MRHIDDGALHAYLDGAHELIGTPGGVDELETHLAECAACQARLEAESAVRDRTAAILAMGAPPATELPPFAALEGRRERGRRRLRGRVPLAWAATVVLAVGAGWIAREVLESPAEQRLSAVSVAAPESQSQGPEAMREGGVVDSPPTRAGTGDTASGRTGAVSPAAVAATGGAGRAAADRPVATDRAVAVEPDEPRSAFAQADEPQEAVILAAPPPPPAALPESRAAHPPSSRTGGLHARVTADEASPPPAPPAQPVEQIVVEEIIVTGAAGTAVAEEPLWRPIDRRAAEAALGRPILIVSDLPVIAIEQPATGPTTTVRVRQRLATGGVLTLQQSLVGPIDTRGDRAAAVAAPSRAAEPEQLAAAADRPSIREVEARQEPGGARVELRDGGLVVHARAPLPLDRLRALLVRLR